MKKGVGLTDKVMHI